MTTLTDVQEAVLRAICAHGGHSAGTVVDVRTAAHALDLQLAELYQAVLGLTNAGYLDYLGAGPKVRVTDLGASLCGHITSPQDPNAAAG